MAFISGPGCDRQSSPLISVNSIKSHETALSTRKRVEARGQAAFRGENEPAAEV